MRSRYDLLKLDSAELLAIADSDSEDAPAAAKCVIVRREMAETGSHPFVYKVTAEYEQPEQSGIRTYTTTVTVTGEHIGREEERQKLIVAAVKRVKEKCHCPRVNILDITEVLSGGIWPDQGLTREEFEEQERQANDVDSAIKAVINDPEMHYSHFLEKTGFDQNCVVCRLSRYIR